MVTVRWRSTSALRVCRVISRFVLIGCLGIVTIGNLVMVRVSSELKLPINCIICCSSKGRGVEISHNSLMGSIV